MARIGLRERKAARTRDQLARAARECFLKQGYANTTLEEIAEAADLCKRTLLRYFPTKAHLILHSQYAALEDFQETVSRRGQRPILDIWEDHVSFYARSRSQALKASDLSAIVALDPDIGPAMMLIGANYREILARELCVDLGLDPATDVLTKVASAALAIGSYAVSNMMLVREAYEEIEAAEMEVVRLVREDLLKLPPSTRSAPTWPRPKAGVAEARASASKS